MSGSGGIERGDKALDDGIVAFAPHRAIRGRIGTRIASVAERLTQYKVIGIALILFARSAYADPAACFRDTD